MLTLGDSAKSTWFFRFRLILGIRIIGTVMRPQEASITPPYPSTWKLDQIIVVTSNTYHNSDLVPSLCLVSLYTHSDTDP